MKKDIFGKEPNIGDILIFNPPKYKGLVYGTCVGFGNTGLPKVFYISAPIDNYVDGKIKKDGFYLIRTDFVVK